MNISKIIMVLLLVMEFPLTRAQEIHVRAELDTNRALIGDQIKLRLSVEKPAGVEVGFPLLKDTIAREIEIINHPAVDTGSVTSGRVLLKQELLISVFDTGLYEIPSLAFTIKLNGVTETLKTEPQFFEIVSVRADSTIRDIKAIEKTPLNLAEIIQHIKENYLYYALVAGILVLLILVIRYIRLSRSRDNIVPKQIYLELPEVTALRELEKLKTEKPWLHNKVKLYHIRISEILRNYIERRFKIMALEQTTDEILITLKPPVCKASDHNCLSSVLKLADLVKFAKVIPDVAENATQINLATEFINDTTVHEVTAAPESNAEVTMIQSNSSS